MANQWESLVLPEDSEERVWEWFHEASKVSRFDSSLPTPAVLARMAQLWESLPYSGYEAIPLPEHPLPLTISLEQALRERATARSIAPRRLSLDEVATVLHYAYGVTRDNAGTVFPRPFRMVPSGGGLYPLELYFHSVNIDGLKPGLYHFNPVQRCVRLLREGDDSRRLSEAMVQGQLALDSSLLLFVTAVFERSTFKYADRGYRFALIEAGHVAQNTSLAASALGLGTVVIGGYFDREIDKILELDGLCQSTIYMIGLGLETRGQSPAPEV